MSSIRPLSLARLNASHADALRRLGAADQGFELAGLTAPGEPSRLRLSPISARERPQIDSAGYIRMSMEWGGGRILLDVTPEGAGAWVRALLGSELYAQLPAEWIETGLAHAVERISALMEPAGRGPLQLISLGPIAAGESLPEGFHPFWFEAGLAAERLQGVLHMDSMSLLLASSQLPVPDTSSGDSSALTVPVTLLLSIGHTDLEHSELQRLKPRGVVMIAEPYSTEARRLILCTPPGSGKPWAMAAVLEDNQLNILERMHPMATDAVTDNGADDAPVDLGRLPVRLSFDLGERTITLGELQGLDAGSTLPLDRPLQDFVTIRANGAVVGEGQLVDMDGRLGVMVSRLSLDRGGN